MLLVLPSQHHKDKHDMLSDDDVEPQHPSPSLKEHSSQTQGGEAEEIPTKTLAFRPGLGIMQLGLCMVQPPNQGTMIYVPGSKLHLVGMVIPPENMGILAMST